ncbi:hypothetical protein [Pseudomonas rhodesiae]|uniref:hypothetical protein n=1 Tax=Pseudomonas rhodesiae TaxID=76760 RepID=UPI0028D03C5E|nr:hypothetical protein [Pseudomonas rhodesiae]
MAHWDSYDYPQDSPKVKITFGPQREGHPVVAFLGKLEQPEQPGPMNPAYLEEVKGPWASEEEARTALNLRAEQLIHHRKL